MIGELKFVWREQRPIDVPIRRWREIGKNVHEAVAEWWVKELLPDHFTPGAAAKYGYQPRTFAYKALKLKRFAKGRGNAEARRLGPIDLVYSGRMFKALKEDTVIRPFPSRANILMNGPQYISGVAGGGIGKGLRVDRNGGYINPKTGKLKQANKRPDLAREIKKDTPAQLIQSAVKFDEALTAELNNNNVTIVEEL
jgi:hypothetical protein